MSKVSEEIKFKLEDINASWRAKTKKQKAGVIAILLTGGVLVGFGISYATQPSEEEVFKQQQEQVDGLLEELGAYTEEEKEVLSMEAEEGSELYVYQDELKKRARERVGDTDLDRYRIKDTILRDGYYIYYDATTPDQDLVDTIVSLVDTGKKVTVIYRNIEVDGQLMTEIMYKLDQNEPDVNVNFYSKAGKVPVGYKVTDYKLNKVIEDKNQLAQEVSK